MGPVDGQRRVAAAPVRTGFQIALIRGPGELLFMESELEVCFFSSMHMRPRSMHKSALRSCRVFALGPIAQLWKADI